MTPALDVALRLFLPSFFLVYVLVAGVSTVARMRRRYGVDPLAARSPDPVTALGESYRNALFALALGLACVHALRPAWLVHLGPIPALQAPAVRFAGVLVLLASLALVHAAQLRMGASWRLGCDQRAVAPPLVVTGLFAWSRNPIYVGLTLTALGLFLVLPNALTFAMANLTFLLLQIRIRVEETYLAAAHREAFAAYCRRTPRWLLVGRGR